MLENLKRQTAVLPTIDRVKTLEMLMHLQTMYFGDDEAVAKYGEAAYWNALAKGQMTCSNNSSSSSSSSSSTSTDEEADSSNDNTMLSQTVLHQITTEGYHVLPSPKTTTTNNQSNYSSTAFTGTLKALKDAGWPPQFLLLYDEPWELLQDTVRQITGGNNNNITIESDVNIWSLHKHSPPGSYIGGNFKDPHRDMIFSACHDDEERPTSLSVWIPLNLGGATEFNGCMRCLPIERDDFFYSPQHPRHSTNSQYTDDDDAEKLIVEQFGCGVWDPTLVHWGGSYEADRCEEEPRSSLAFTLRLGSKAADFGTVAVDRIPGIYTPSEQQANEKGPGPVLLKDCDNGGLRRRIQVVAKSLLSYSHHWPGFPYDGFNANLKQPKLALVHEPKFTKKRTSNNLHSLLNDGISDNRTQVEGDVSDDAFHQLAKQKVLQELDSLYEEYTFATAKDASLTDDLQRPTINKKAGDQEHNHTEDSLVYGEIDLRGFCDLLMNDIPHDSQDTFYDLGSGSGKAVFAARFVGDFQECVGIELLSNLHDLASSVRSLYKFQYQHKLVHQNVQFICSDLLDCDGWWKYGTVVYVPNLLFDDNLKYQIAEKAVKLRTGAYLICLKKFKNVAFNSVFDLVKERPVAMSWGESNVYIYQRQ